MYQSLSRNQSHLIFAVFNGNSFYWAGFSALWHVSSANTDLKLATERGQILVWSWFACVCVCRCVQSGLIITVRGSATVLVVGTTDISICFLCLCQSTASSFSHSQSPTLYCVSTDLLVVLCKCRLVVLCITDLLYCVSTDLLYSVLQTCYTVQVLTCCTMQVLTCNLYCVSTYLPSPMLYSVSTDSLYCVSTDLPFTLLHSVYPSTHCQQLLM